VDFTVKQNLQGKNVLAMAYEQRLVWLVIGEEGVQDSAGEVVRPIVRALWAD
jgi:hypothetical protein